MENDRNTLKTWLSVPSRLALRPHWYSYAAKRLVDLLASALGLLFLAPFFAFLAVLIKRDSPGPAFYRGPRMGKDGRIFPILKFRTMREEAASYAGPSVTARGDGRITELGKWLRDTKFNELPQLWNVLIGQMSLVGPRPEVPEIARQWPEAARREILSVRPGITSPASVAYHDEESRLGSASVMEDYVEKIQPDKLRLDQLYVRHHTFMGDLDALFWTFVVLIPRLRDQRIPEGWLFGGPLTRLVRRYVHWIVIDFLVAFLSIGLLGALWRLHGPLDIGLDKSIYLAVVLAFLFGFFNTLLGLKTVAWSRAAAEDVLRLFVSCGLVTVAVVGLQLLVLPKPVLPLPFMYTAGLVVLLGFMAARYRLRLVTGLASRWITWRKTGFGAGERVLVIGAGDGGEFATWLLRRPDFRQLYSVVGFVDDQPSKQGLRFDGYKVLGTTADIPALVKRFDIGVIFYAITNISPADNQRILSNCKKASVHLVMLSDLVNTLHDRLARDLPGCEKKGPGRVGPEEQTEPVAGEPWAEEFVPMRP